MSGVRFPVSASADRSLGSVFEPFIASAARARDANGRFLSSTKQTAKQAGDALSQEAERAAGAAAKAYAQIEKMSAHAAAQEVADAERTAQAKIKADQKAFDEKLKEVERRQAAAKRAADAEEREIMRTAAAAERSEERKRVAAEKHDTKEREKRVRAIGRDAMQTFAGVARAGVDVASEIVGGTGVNFDLGASVGRATSLEATAGRSTTSAATAEGRVADPKEILATIQSIQAAGTEAKLDFNKIGQGLEDFVSKSSDLKTGKQVLTELALTARATGTEVDKLISAAGDVNKELGDSPDKAERLLTIMRLVAKQGALGNVEVKDLATYMGKLTASAFLYEGNKDSNIGILGALAQISMRGGATSAAEGTRAASSFARDITKEAAAKRFSAAGIDIYADEEKTKLRSPEKIITDFYQKSGGNLSDLASLFQNEMSKKVVLGFGQVADQARARGEDPIQAIHNEFAKFGATLSKEDVHAAAEVSGGTKEARAQAFQNQLDIIASSLADRVLPALEKLAPTAIEIVDAFGRVVGWAAENPGMAITTAIVGSIGKAAIGSVVSTAIEKTISAAAGSGKGLGLAVGAATIGISVGTILAQQLNEGKASGREDTKGQIAVNEENLARAEKEFKEKGTLSEETMAMLERQRAVVAGQIKEGNEAKDRGAFGSLYEHYFGDKNYQQQGREAQARQDIGTLVGEQKGIDALIAAVKETTAATRANKNITVDNMQTPQGAGPAAPRGVNAGAPGAT